MSTMAKKNGFSLHEKTMIGHIHLTVSNLKESVRFYSEILGFEITQDLGSAVFLSAGGYHHHIGLNTWSSPGARKPEEGQIGLYHFAILFPNRKELARALLRLMDFGWPIEGASDHGVSEAIYLRDPDENMIELYADRPKNKGKKGKKIEMFTHPLDVKDLLKEAD